MLVTKFENTGVWKGMYSLYYFHKVLSFYKDHLVYYRHSINFEE